MVSWNHWKVVNEIDRQQNVAIYMRISDEDKELEEGRESTSIAGQRMLLRDFVGNQKDLKGCTVVEVIDDGYSGTDFQRPGIQALLEMAKRKEVCCIVVKDFSRFGRNYVEVGNYLEQIFPFLGIRFLSVNDGFDSFFTAGAAGALDVGFKNIIYEAYSKDLSEKIKSVRKIKAEQGKFVTAFAPYGYKKDEQNRNRLMVDPECAPIVRRIFSQYLSGVTKTDIARQLNQEGIPCPMKIRKKRCENLNRKLWGDSLIWTVGTVSNILADQRYTGDAVYGKVKPKSVGSKKELPVPKEQWIIVPDSHEGIISHEEFKAVERRKKSYRKIEKGNQKKSLFAKKIRCKSCGHLFIRMEKNKKISYCCKSGRNLYESKCYQGKVGEQELKNALFTCLHNFAFIINQPLKSQEPNKLVPINHLNDLKNLQLKIETLNRKKISIYEAYKKEKLLETVFRETFTELEHSIAILKNQCHRLEQELILADNEVFKSSPDERCSREMIDIFIEIITVGTDGALTIRWSFMDPFICP